MLVKEIKPITVLHDTQRTTLSTISKYVSETAKKLYAEAVKAGLEVSGPIYWIYYGADGKPDTEFTLEISLPVLGTNGQSNLGAFKIKRLPSFKCVSTILNGSWEQLPATYDQLIKQIYANGLQMTNVCREVYINFDFDSPENNITEVQIGIQ